MGIRIPDEDKHGVGGMGEVMPDISGIFASDVVTAISRIGFEPDALFAQERAYIGKASISRQREFATGRLLARSLLARIGILDTPLLVNEDRSPAWPATAVGSISHAGEVCIVVLAVGGEVLGLGVDLEHNEPLEPELIDSTCTANEGEWLGQRSHLARGFLARVIFSAKECALKCQYALTRSQLEYDDLEIEMDLGCQTFTARVRGPAGRQLPENGVLYGRYRASGRWIVSGITLRRSAIDAQFGSGYCRS